MTRVANDGPGRREDLPRPTVPGAGSGPMAPGASDGPDAPMPTGPGLALRRVLDLEVLKGSMVRAGERGLDRPVTRVNVMEVPDVLPYVRRDELLVTTGYALREDPDRLGPLVRELHARGVAALGIKLGRYLDELPVAALQAGDELGFPVIQLPASTSYDELLTHVLTAVLDHQAERLTRSESLHRALLQVVLDGGDLSEVASALATILDVRVLLTDPDGMVMVSAVRPDASLGSELDGRDGPAAGRDLDDPELMGAPASWWSGTAPFDRAGRLDQDALRRGRHARGDGHGGYAVVPIVAGRQDHGRIVALAGGRAVSAVDLQALERAATVCALAITKEQAVTAVESKYRADFLRDLLLGRAGGPSRTVPHAQGLGWDMARSMVVVVVEPDAEDARWAPVGESRGARSPRAEDAGPLDLRPEVERLAAAWIASIRRRDPDGAVAGFTTEVVAVLGAPSTDDLERWVRELTSAMRGDRGTFSVGVSRVVPGVAQLPTAYDEARRALAVGRQVHGDGAVASFDRLGVHRLLSLVPDPAELRSFERETLGELAEDTAEAADLRRTLQVLLDTNLNVAQAARALHFHYNTLRYRIAKLERILGPFTTDPLLRLDLALALRVVQMRGIAR